MSTEFVDVLSPPHFNRSGITKPLEQAWTDEDWIGTFNLWILRTCDQSIIYQQRSSLSSWEPNKLDVSVGGHYSAGENIKDGLREAKEELGRQFEFENLLNLGRRLNVSVDEKGRRRNNVVDILLTVDNSSLKEFLLEEREVTGIFVCPVEKLIEVHSQPDVAFESQGIDGNGHPLVMKVTKDSFPFNWDNYHFKMALLAERYFKGECHLLY